MTCLCYINYNVLIFMYIEAFYIFFCSIFYNKFISTTLQFSVVLSIFCCFVIYNTTISCVSINFISKIHKRRGSTWQSGCPPGTDLWPPCSPPRRCSGRAAGYLVKFHHLRLIFSFSFLFTLEVFLQKDNVRITRTHFDILAFLIFCMTEITCKPYQCVQNITQTSVRLPFF